MAISIERAVEIILQGEGTFMCRLCMGQGITQQIHDVYESCLACSGSGQVRNPEYDEACEVLDQPKPVIENPVEKAWQEILKSKADPKSDARLSMKTLRLAEAFSVSPKTLSQWGKPYQKTSK